MMHAGRIQHGKIDVSAARLRCGLRDFSRCVCNSNLGRRVPVSADRFSNARSHPDVLPFAVVGILHIVCRKRIWVLLRAFRSTTNARHSLHLSRLHRIVLYHRGHVRSHVHARLYRCRRRIPRRGMRGNLHALAALLFLNSCARVQLEAYRRNRFWLPALFHALPDSRFTYRIPYSHSASADLRAVPISFGARDGL